MLARNDSLVTEFILAGLTDRPELQQPLFCLFLMIYIVTLVGNLGLIILIGLNSHLHTPMYYFLFNLSFVDLCYSSVFTPKMLMNFVSMKNIISYVGCMTQLFFFLFFVISECYMLTSMAYDRYVAICNPLLYKVTMSRRVCVVLSLAAYVMGFAGASAHTGCMLRLTFCNVNIINHYLCDILPLLQLSCTSTYVNELVVLIVFVAGVSATLNYENEEKVPLEAFFVFPMDEDSAVYSFEAMVDGSIIKAELQDKTEAHANYENAISQGHQAFLLEEDDCSRDVFCCNVGNLRPGSKVALTLKYVQELPLEADGALRYVLPAILNPRYQLSGCPEDSCLTMKTPVVPLEDLPYTISMVATVSSQHGIERIQSNCSLSPIEYLGDNKTSAQVSLADGHKFDRDVELLIYYSEVHAPSVAVEMGEPETKPGGASTTEEHLCDLSICEFVAGVSATLNYENEEKVPLEAFFVFPMDEDSAVYSFEAMVDGSIIKAELQDKTEAHANYENAISQGHQAFLLEEDDCSRDVFCCNVGNLRPGLKVALTLKYVQELPLEADGALRYVLPAILNPRYQLSGCPEDSCLTMKTPVVPLEDLPYTISMVATVSSQHGIERTQSNCSLSPVEYLGDNKTSAQVSLADGHKFDRDVELLIYYSEVHAPSIAVEMGEPETKPAIDDCEPGIAFVDATDAL
ncbi:von Willebrand factor A domain-containing protein 5A [Camelus dromedarius]|uniref:von Willebrand factor A domain-containing protein 5A n=1 Tax=Camelus dromedarius TaxID=9838 RepID=A0A5N4C7R5_CAMDR|nr:von Willebrand factor A domain-containing protein 5A [Camelus dromedarius]